MSASLVTLLVELAKVAPGLVMQLLAIWNQQGKVTAQEIADFLSSSWPSAESFFVK